MVSVTTLDHTMVRVTTLLTHLLITTLLTYLLTYLLNVYIYIYIYIIFKWLKAIAGERFNYGNSGRKNNIQIELRQCDIKLWCFKLGNIRHSTGIPPNFSLPTLQHFFKPTILLHFQQLRNNFGRAKRCQMALKQTKSHEQFHMSKWHLKLCQISLEMFEEIIYLQCCKI